MDYRADIDGLRAIAVLLVLIFHFNLFGLGDSGFMGVDVFFVISGYLISKIIWRELDAGHFRLGDFYIKRVRRLAPALIAIQLAIIGLAAMLLLPSEVLSLARESAFTQLYVSNIYYWKSINYFGGHADHSFLLHTWSLGVEEQYYLIYPLVLIAVHRFTRLALAPVLIGLALISFGINVAFVGGKPEAVFYLLPTRAWEMLAGALVICAEQHLAANAVQRGCAGVGAVALLVAGMIAYGPGMMVPGWFALLPTGAACLFLLAGANEGSAIARVLATPILVWIGRISYPLYLVHWPFHILALTLLPVYGLGERWAMFALSFFSAWGVYRAIEMPMRHRHWLADNHRLLVAYISSVALVLVFASSALVSGGWSFRLAPDVLHIADASNTFDPVEQRLDYAGGAVDQWLRPIGIASNRQTPHWLLFGDSHAGALAKAASLWLDGRAEAGLVGYHNSCMPVLNTGNAICRQFTTGIMDYITAHREIGSVILISIWRQPTEAGFTDASGRVVTGPQAVAAFDAALRTTLVRLHKLGVRTYVWEPLPAMPHNVPETMTRTLVFGNYWPNHTSLAKHRATFGFLDTALVREAPLIAGRMPTTYALCAKDVCSADQYGIPLFEDNNHPAFAQAPFFAAIFQHDLENIPRATSRHN